MGGIKRVCKDCGRCFQIADGEARFFIESKLSLPVRCKVCREKNRRLGGSIAELMQPETRKSKGNGRTINRSGTQFETIAEEFIPDEPVGFISTDFLEFDVSSSRPASSPLPPSPPKRSPNTYREVTHISRRPADETVKSCMTCWVMVAGGCLGRSTVCKDYFEYKKG